MLPAFIERVHVQAVCHCSQSKSYNIIRDLNAELKKDGFMVPGRGRVSSAYFCKRLGIDPKLLEREVQQIEKTRKASKPASGGNDGNGGSDGISRRRSVRGAA